MLTRRQVAARLGKSIATVRRLEGTHLHPHRDADGVYRFAPREVEALVADLTSRRVVRPGAQASAGWKGWLAERMGDPPTVAITAPAHPRWRAPSSAELIADDEADLARQFDALSDLLDASPRRARRVPPGLLEALRDLLGR